MRILSCVPREDKRMQAPCDDRDPLGTLILDLLPLVEADRADRIYQGPTECWLDALAVCWARTQLAAQWKETTRA